MTDHRTTSAPMDAPAVPPATGPTGAARRALSIDALRGFAILGILAVNIQYFAMGLRFVPDDPGVIDFAVRDFVGIFFESKFIAIFSLLFGAGIVLMDRSAERTGGRWTGRYLRRTGVLLAMGVLHAYLLWYGDILFTYALLGFAVFWLRRLPPWLLLTIGAAWFLFGLAITGWIHDFHDDSFLTPHAEEVAAARAGFASRMGVYALMALFYQTIIFFIFSLWFNAGLMLVGMALCKSGFLEGRWRPRWYALIIGTGLVVALPIIILARTTLPQGEIINAAWAYANFSMAPVLALAYASVVILVCTRSAPNFLTGALAAVGRTALSNYVLQSVVCVVVFYHVGLIGRVADAQAQLIALAIWAGQLVISPLWLRAFRFGPLEWAWRSATYLRWQPMLRRR